MLRLVTIMFALAMAAAGVPALAANAIPAAPAAAPPAPTAKKVECATPSATEAIKGVEARKATSQHEDISTGAAAPRVLFKLNSADDAPTILRFVTNYIAVEPTAEVAVVGYAGGIDFMLKDAKDPNGKPYSEQLAALADRGVAFKVCNNTLKARNLTASAVSPLASVVPGAVNEIIRLQTKEGYAYFQN
jgi:intracellular sulfur oxidation DsrE/DsrF family protein